MNDKVDLKLKKGQQRKDILTVDYTDIFIFLSIYLQLDFQNVSSFSHCCCLILFIICFYCRLHHSFSFLLFLILYRKKRYWNYLRYGMFFFRYISSFIVCWLRPKTTFWYIIFEFFFPLTASSQTPIWKINVWKYCACLHYHWKLSLIIKKRRELKVLRIYTG